MKKILSVLCCLLLLTGCAPKSSPGGTYHLTVTGKENAVLLDTSAVIQDGDTVLSILRRETAATGIAVSESGAGTAAYVTQIGDIAAGDDGDMSGWIFEVNDEAVFTAAGLTAVQDGDKIHWEYITDFTEQSTKS